ncbi:integral membrane sensor signal transduction histidine kinase [Cyclobacterium marinum DSM 745]|uniref:histidine kinase n=2 Tax=Cyclobacterium marinum TaxID=104 RepID=G0IZT5_CYCMS|nr:integral membrane sensor signal transduction histidine kinase [Cyclobacterium marinum DSM 745]
MIERYWTKIRRLGKHLFYLEGDPSMELQIYNALLIITIFSCLIFVIFNLVLSNIVLLWASLGAALFLLGCFYLLRVKNAFKTSFYLALSMSYLVFVFTFLNHEGIYGPTFYMLLLVHLIIHSIVKLKYHFFWSIVNGLFFLGLFYIGLYHDELITQSYTNKDAVFIDHGFTYIVAIIGFTLLINSVRQFYENQRSKVKEQTVAMAKTNSSLQKTSAQKDRIITIISHDLKNPLHSIIQTLKLVNSGMLDEEEVKLLNEELLNTTNRTFQMMENILEWSSFELKNETSQIKKILIKDLIDDTVEILKVIARQKKINIEVNYHKNPLVNIETDRLLLIFRNLVQNAIKFTPADGLIVISINSEEGFLILEVSDNGIGISPERLKNIFEQDIKSTYGTEQEKGTGMGLHFCNQSAHKLSRKLEVESTEGEGSTFKLVIPTGIH